MTDRPSIRRRIARSLARHAAVIMPPARSAWAEALRYEIEHIDNDRAALGWAVGSVFASCRERVLAMNLLQTRMASWVLALLALWRALRMFFAPGLTIAYRMHDLGIAEVLGSRTPGDDYHRFIPVMDATPIWLLALEVVSGLLYAVTAWRLARNGRGAFGLFAAALLLEVAAAAAGQIIPGLAELSRQAFSFPEPNIRRDYLLPAAQVVLLVILGIALRHRDRSRPKRA